MDGFWTFREYLFGKVGDLLDFLLKKTEPIIILKKGEGFQLVEGDQASLKRIRIKQQLQHNFDI